MDFFDEIWQTISKNRSRSLLTAFGVFWGMLMLMILIGLGNAMTNGIYGQLEGANMNYCSIGTNQTSKPYKGFQSGRSWEILNSDLPKVKQQVSGIKAFAPICFAGNALVSYKDNHETYSVRGVTPEFNQVMRIDLLFGRFINQIDIEERRKVCVIGIEVYKVLFPNGENPLGRNITCGSVQYSIIGVKKQASSRMFIGGNPDKMVQIPLTTAQQVYNYGEDLHSLLVLGEDNVDMKVIETEVQDVLKSLHNVAPDDKKAIWSWNMSEELKSINYLTMGLTALVWLIGLGTLISGAVGVSNIMLVTVKERTKEIGIRRAIGATPWVIMKQIIAESVLLTSIAGVVGLIFGIGILAIVDPMVNQMEVFFKNPQVSLLTAIICLLIIVLIGVLAGLLPALRALKIKPIEALSEE
ncbi:MAG: ABC transporter permease [Paludibacteraceae bacterium]|nr:ABC transporter permease [Paludibacteraceae bacterium]